MWWWEPASFQILFTCINVTIMQANTNHTVDFVLALVLLVGSTLGAQFGAKISRHLKGDQLKVILASLVSAGDGQNALTACWSNPKYC